MNKFFRFPFATTGDKTAVPDAVDSNGNVSYSQGYGFDYQRQKTDPAAKNIERDKMNQIFYDLTTALREYQVMGTPDFITAALNGGVAFSYSLHARVRYDDGGGFKIYESKIDANTDLPTVTASWRVVDLASFALRVGDVLTMAAGSTAPTPAQFDNDTSLATTEFSQRALGNRQGAKTVSAVETLVAADSGKLVVLAGGAPFTVTLPLLADVRAGVSIAFVHVGSGGARTIAAQGADVIDKGGATIASITMAAGDSLTLTSNGSFWNIEGGSAGLKYAGAFAGTLSANGYQPLPGGFILQWMSVNSSTSGVVNNFPIPFPTNAFQAIVANNTAASSSIVLSNGAPTLTGVTVYSSTGAPGGTVFAIGN